jgi:hypothetical protein
MKITRKAVTTLGGISLATLLVAAFLPKATHSAASMQSSPIVFQHLCRDNVAESFAHCSISVPAGERLIIQTVSLGTLNNSGVRVINGFLNATPAPNPESTPFLAFGVPFTGTDTLSGFDLSNTTQELSFYVDGGNGTGAVQCGVIYNQAPTTSSFACQVVGYLVAVSPS